MQNQLFSREENVAFWKNLILVSIFFLVTPLTIGLSLFSLVSIQKSALADQTPTESIVLHPQSGVKVFASLPMNIPSVSGSPQAADARSEIIKQYLEYYNSPLVPLSGFIVQKADEYGIDFRLTTAIAQQESNLCKIIPPGSYNCWGWGITGESTLGFNSYAEGIDTVSKGLRIGYIDKGYKTVEQIMSIYTPASNGSWAKGVNEFMTAMQ